MGMGDVELPSAGTWGHTPTEQVINRASISAPQQQQAWYQDYLSD
jgi:hypothetical protein